MGYLANDHFDTNGNRHQLNIMDTILPFLFLNFWKWSKLHQMIKFHNIYSLLYESKGDSPSSAAQQSDPGPHILHISSQYRIKYEPFTLLKCQ